MQPTLDLTPILAEMNDSLTVQNELLYKLSDLPVIHELIFNRLELVVFINILLLTVTIYMVARRSH